MSLIKFDLCVIGAGSGGLSVAAAAAAFGVSVVLIEKAEMGGDCLNVGCVPSKALICAAELAATMREIEPFGFAPVDAQVNYARLRDHVRGIIAAIAPNDSVERFTALGVRVIKGEARFIDRRTVDVGGQLIHARRFVVATGSRPAVPPISGLDTVPYLTNETIFDLNKKPAHLVVLGGGPIGVELAQAHARLGTQVTLLEAAQIIMREDPEAAAVLRRALIHDGVDLREAARVIRVQAQGNKSTGKNGITMVIASEQGEETITCSHLLVATGRKPSISSLNCEAAAIQTDARGILVNKGLRTSNRRVFAIGDCASGEAGGLQFTHVANYHAGLVLRSTLFRLPVRLNNQIIPRVTYTQPEIASVGLSEIEARAKHRDVQTLRWPFAENDRAQATRRTQGLIKVMADKKGRILGATIAGPQAGELITPWTLALTQGLNLKDMAGIVVPYPTLSEVSRRVAVSAFAPLTTKPFIRKIIGFLRHFG